jgi:hypothetical protein
VLLLAVLVRLFKVAIPLKEPYLAVLWGVLEVVLVAL